MTSLLRTKSGNFNIENSYTVKELEEMTIEERYSLLCPVEELFADLKEIKLIPFFERLARSGLEIYIKKIGIKEDCPLGTRFRLCGENGFFALGELRRYDDGLAIKPIKQFDI